MSTLVVIMTPKILNYHRAIHGHQEIRPKRGAEIGAVHVSGLEDSSARSQLESTNSDYFSHLEPSAALEAVPEETKCAEEEPDKVASEAPVVVDGGG